LNFGYFGNVECNCMLCNTGHYAIKTQLIRNVNKFGAATLFIFPFTQVPMKFIDDYGLKLCHKKPTVHNLWTPMCP
jgi:hypothetical protein